MNRCEILKATKEPKEGCLLYNPAHLQLESTNKAELMKIYEDTCWCAEHYHVEEMFAHIVDFLAPIICPKTLMNELIPIKESIKFKLCDQNTYRKQFK